MTRREGARQRTALVWTYDADAPSFRHRVAPAVAALRSAGWQVTVDQLPHGRYVARLLERTGMLRRADCLLLGKIKLTAGEWGLVRRLRTAVVLDVDDAIWLRKPRSSGGRPEAGWWRRMKFDRTCAVSDLVLAGNGFLAIHAARSARRVEVVPTSVDASAFNGGGESPTGPTIVWIGLPENLMYLETVREVLEQLARERQDLRLRVVSSRAPEWSAPPIEHVQWSEEVEDRALETATVGIMPLADDDWSRGKCAFKVLQYMAAGLPVVASPVGANRKVILDGETGFLARTPEDWLHALRRLLGDPDLGRDMGAAGRLRVRRLYDRSLFQTRVVDAVEAVTDSGAMPPR